jgi:hypothetical protein
LWANKSLFTDRPIVPESQRDVLPEYQRQAWTSQTAQQLGQLTGRSPAQIEHVTRSYGAGLAKYALQAADWAGQATGLYPSRPPAPAATPADWPVIGAFVARSPSATAEPLQRFYQMAEEIQRTGATVKELRRRDGWDAAQAFRDAHAPAVNQWQQTYGLIMGTQAHLAALRGEQTRISRDPAMSPAAKRAALDALTQQMVSAAAAANRQLDAVRR